MPNIEKLIWTDIEILVEKIASNIQQKELKYDYIVGIPRGGLVPAVMISHILSIPMAELKSVGSIDTAFYNFNRRFLIVDDIMDSGKTLKNYSHLIDKCVLCCKMRVPIQDRPTYYGAEISDDVWISFPWEKDINDSVSEANYKDYHNETRII